MKSKYLISLLLICLLVALGSGQTTYSESSEYKPRPIATPKKDHKKNSDEKDKAVRVPPSNIGGDITVTIPVSVIDRLGSAVGGIKREEISVFVDGSEVPVVSFEQDKEPVTLIIVMDTSPSADVKFKAMREHAAKLINVLPSNMKVMVIDFNESLNVRSQPTTNRKETLKTISKVKMGDGTAIYSAIQSIYDEVLPQVPGRRVLVMMTDGVDTMSENSDFAQSLAEVETESVPIYPIHFDTFADNARLRGNLSPQLQRMLKNANGNRLLGDSKAEYDTGLLYLKDLAAASGAHVFSSEKLDDGTKLLLTELANRYYVTITVPRKNVGSRPVRVRVNRPSLAVFARGSFVEK